MGSLAGPVTVVITAFERDCEPIKGVRDSKKLTKKKRESLAPKIMEAAAFVGVGWAGPKFIDEHGLGAAWDYAVQKALRGAPMERMNLIVDGVREVTGLFAGVVSLPKADDIYWTVGAASIVAKVLRDSHMKEMSGHYPAYSWCKNSGYGTKVHREAILAQGACPYHRQSFLKKLFKGGTSSPGHVDTSVLATCAQW